MRPIQYIVQQGKGKILHKNVNAYFPYFEDLSLNISLILDETLSDVWKMHWAKKEKIVVQMLNFLGFLKIIIFPHVMQKLAILFRSLSTVSSTMYKYCTV